MSHHKKGGIGGHIKRIAKKGAKAGAHIAKNEISRHVPGGDEAMKAAGAAHKAYKKHRKGRRSSAPPQRRDTERGRGRGRETTESRKGRKGGKSREGGGRKERPRKGSRERGGREPRGRKAKSEGSNKRKAAPRERSSHHGSKRAMDEEFGDNMDFMRYGEVDIFGGDMYNNDDYIDGYYYYGELGDDYYNDGHIEHISDALDYYDYVDDDGLDYYYTLRRNGGYGNRYGRRKLLEFGQNEGFMEDSSSWIFAAVFVVGLIMVLLCIIGTFIYRWYKKRGYKTVKMLDIEVLSDEESGGFAKENRVI